MDLDNTGKEILVFGMKYHYSGVLYQVAHDVIILADPYIVYETGPFTDKKWANAEKLPMTHLTIERGAIESRGPVVRGR